MPKDVDPLSISFSEDDVEHAIANPEARALVAEALAQIGMGRVPSLPSADALDASAATLQMDRVSFWMMFLKNEGCLATFAAALRARGLAIENWNLEPHRFTWNERKLQDFLGRAASFRCLVRVDGVIKGSGVLVGPSSVLTAWHVTASARPADPPLQSAIEIVLTDGRVIPAVQLAISSPCGDVEWPPDTGRAPKSDDEVLDRHDVALLRLKQPAGIHLSFAALASPAYEYSGPAAVVLISYPEGEWRGVEFAKLKKLRNLTARWGYDVLGTRGGSSGGGCFDTSFTLAGIHQGRADGAGRLVPLKRFDGIVRKAVQDDETPMKLWSLDGTPEGDLVVGRDSFFSGYQAAMRGPSRVKGLWVRRVNLLNDVSGLPFSFELLEKLVARSPGTTAVRVTFDTMVKDLPTEIARRVSDGGIPTVAPEAAGGVGTNQSEPEAVIADRCRRLADALNEHARSLGVLLWLFFEHPSAAFGEELRWALSAFVDRAVRVDCLRIALAGFEAIQMPCAQFEAATDALSDGPPGLMIDYLVDVTREDVVNLIRFAAADLGTEISPERTKEWADEALKDLNPVNDYYDSTLRGQIASRLQPRIKQLRDQGENP